MLDTRWKKPAGLLLAVGALGVGVAGCGSTKSSSDTSSSGGTAAATTAGDTGAAIKKGLNVVVMPKQLGNPYEELEDKGTVAAIKETGGTAKIQGATDAGAASQVPILRSIVQQKPDAIVLAANDPNAVVPVLKQAQA